MPKSIGIWEEVLFGEIMNQKLRVKMEDKFKQWNGVKPNIVAEPYCGSWSRPFPQACHQPKTVRCCQMPQVVLIALKFGTIDLMISHQ